MGCPVLGPRVWGASCARFACLACVNGAGNGVCYWVCGVFLLFAFFLHFFLGARLGLLGVLVWTVVLDVLIVPGTGVCI